jgi:hypothetical protein
MRKLTTYRDLVARITPLPTPTLPPSAHECALVARTATALQVMERKISFHIFKKTTS